MKKIITILFILLLNGCLKEEINSTLDGFWVNIEHRLDVCSNRVVYEIKNNKIQEELVLTGLEECNLHPSELYYIGASNVSFIKILPDVILIENKRYMKLPDPQFKKN